jgi:predicted enzyme related to lactoylglutathione lyase
MAHSSNQQHAAADTAPRLVGINHVALEVGDIGEALDFYGQLFAFELRGRFIVDHQIEMTEKNM